MENLSKVLLDIIDDMLKNLYEGEYDGCNGSWEREMYFDVERHPEFKKLKDYPKTPTETICSKDIVVLVKYVDMQRRVVRDEARRAFEKSQAKDTV